MIYHNILSSICLFLLYTHNEMVWNTNYFINFFIEHVVLLLGINSEIVGYVFLLLIYSLLCDLFILWFISTFKFLF